MENKKEIIYKQKKEKTNLFYLNVGRNEIVMLNKKEFKDIEAPVVQYKGNILKFRGCSRKEALNALRFVPQSITNDFSNLFTGFKILIDVCRKIGSIKNNLDDNVIMNLIRVAHSVFDLVNEMKFSRAIRLLIDLYCVFHGKIDLFKKQSLDSTILMLSSLLMPDSLLNVLKKLQLLSNVKILDEYSHITQFIDCIFSYIDAFCDLINLPPYFKDILLKMGLYHNKRTVLVETEKILVDWKSNKDIVYNVYFQERVGKIVKLWDNPIMDDWIKRSGGVQGLKNKFDILNKIVFSVTNLTRQEPSCFVFEGPPGCMKSFTMNHVVKLLGESVYTHVTKSSNDGKDFYDSYNNEKVFVMDDVGQQGVDQWRNIINMVSSTQYKLDCAAQHLKDLKIFTSNTILVTTNNFVNLPPLTRQDGISDVKALWRRGYVFDFSQVKRKGAGIVGLISFKYFNIKEGKFEVGFPVDLINKLRDYNLEVPDSTHIITSRVNYLTWIVRIIKSFDLLKGDIEISNRLEDFEIDDIVRNSNPYQYKKEEFFDAQTLGVFDYYVELLSDVSSKLFNMIVENPVATIVSLSFVCLLYCVITREGKKVSFKLESLEGVKFDYNNNERLSSIGKSIFECEISNNVDNKHCFALVSGLNIIVPLHCVIKNDSYITLRRYGSGNVVVDRANFTVVYMKESEDLAILRLPTFYPTPFKSIVKHFTNTRGVVQKLGLVTPLGNIKLDSRLIKPISSVYDAGQYKLSISEKNTIQYEKVHGEGMCGLILASESDGIFGMHVAGSDELNVGVSMIWSANTITDIINILLVKPAFELPESKDTLLPNSVVKLNMKGEQYLNTKSSIVESPLFECFPCTREPADLVINGRHTVKDVAKKSFDPVVGSITPEEKEFARDILHCIIGDFSDISDKEIISGNENLAGMNKDSSNGYKINDEKTDYIDFVNGCFKDKTNEKLENIESDIKKGDIKLEDHIWFECLKDEVRDKRKNKVPRSFRVATIWNQIWMKRIFGDFVSHLIVNRDFHGIQVGVNPYKHWHEMYKKLQEYDIVWDADVKSWDGRMNPEVQNLINEVLLEHYKGDHKEVAECLLQNMVNTPVVINDDVVVTTHSMPSGSFLTAVLNSLVNKVYTAMWFKRCLGKKATVYLFFDKLLDWAYGDDKMNGTKIYPDLLNAVSMRDFFESIGMEFTDASKKRVEFPSTNINELSFLKRKFLYHPLIQKVMCPLDLNTLYSGLSWVDSKKDIDVVVRDKIHSFQREMYLHPRYLYLEAMDKLKRCCLDRGIDFVLLPESYLLELYKKGDIPYKGMLEGVYY